jgi:hypothetical protein
MTAPQDKTKTVPVPKHLYAMIGTTVTCAVSEARPYDVWTFGPLTGKDYAGTVSYNWTFDRGLPATATGQSITWTMPADAGSVGASCKITCVPPAIAPYDGGERGPDSLTATASETVINPSFTVNKEKPGIGFVNVPDTALESVSMTGTADLKPRCSWATEQVYSSGTGMPGSFGSASGYTINWLNASTDQTDTTLTSVRFAGTFSSGGYYIVKGTVSVTLHNYDDDATFGPYPAVSFWLGGSQAVVTSPTVSPSVALRAASADSLHTEQQPNATSKYGIKISNLKEIQYLGTDSKYHTIAQALYVPIHHSVHLRAVFLPGTPKNINLQWAYPGSMSGSSGMAAEFTFDNLSTTSNPVQTVECRYTYTDPITGEIKSGLAANLPFVVYSLTAKAVPQIDFPGRSKSRVGVKEVVSIVPQFQPGFDGIGKITFTASGANGQIKSKTGVYVASLRAEAPTFTVHVTPLCTSPVTATCDISVVEPVGSLVENAELKDPSGNHVSPDKYKRPGYSEIFARCAVYMTPKDVSFDNVTFLEKDTTPVSNSATGVFTIFANSGHHPNARASSGTLDPSHGWLYGIDTQGFSVGQRDSATPPVGDNSCEYDIPWIYKPVGNDTIQGIKFATGKMFLKVNAVWKATTHKMTAPLYSGSLGETFAGTPPPNAGN